MKGRILAAFGVFGLSILVAGMGPAFAGGNDPQEHRTWQYEEAIETGALPPADVEKPAAEAGTLRGPDMRSAPAEIDVDPRWKDSGGE